MGPETPSPEISILYIDDDEALGVLLRKCLGRKGFKVVHVLDGKSGLALLSRGGVQAIALDHFLIGETGLDILPEITAQPNHPPVVYVTGTGDTNVAAQALSHGAADCVMKTVSPDFLDRLAAALTQAIMRAGLSGQTGA